MEEDPEWDWNPKWKQRCLKREFSSGSMAAENPMIGNVFSVQLLFSIAPAMGCFQNVLTQLLLGSWGELANNGHASQPLWGECWLPNRPFSSEHVKLGCHVFAFIFGYAIILLGCNVLCCCKATLGCAESVIKYDPSHIVPTVHHALSKTLSSWHFFTFTFFSETSVSFPWLQRVQQ